VILWLDAQLSPALGPWITETFAVTARAVRELGLRDATIKLKTAFNRR